MVDFSSLLPAGLPANSALLPTLLDLLPLGVMYYTPVVDTTGTLTDLNLVYLNPAAQRMTQLPAQPGITYRQQFPTTDNNGAWEFHRRSWLSQEPQQFQFYYDADGFDSYFRVTAQHLGQGLLTLFTDTRDEKRSDVEKALHESQLAEKAARAEAETQRQRFYDLLMQLPAQVAVHEGAAHAFTLVNPGYQRLAPGRHLQGQPVREAWPELVGQGILDVLDQVYQTGEPFVGKELPFQVDFTRTGQVEQVYFNCFYLPLRDAQGQVSGILDFSYNVTEQVLARQHVEQLNRVAQTAREEAEAERRRLTQVLQRLPANIALLRGPQHVYDFVNPAYERLFPGRSPLGRPLREVIPELEGQGFYELFDRVYETGKPFYQPEMEAWADFAGTGAPQRRYYRTAFEPIRDAQGQVAEVLNFAVDVTEQVEARQVVEQLNQELESRVQARTQELHEQQALLGRILEQVPAAVGTLHGPEHRFTYFNEQYQQITHGRAADGLSVAEALPEAAAQGFIALLDQVYQTGEPFVASDFPIALRQPDGSMAEYYLSFVYRPLRDQQGAVNGILAFAVDVTGQVLARRQNETLQAELLAAAQRQAAEREGFYHVLEQAPVGVTLMRGRALRFEYVNPAFQRLFPDRPLRGLTVATAFPEGESQGFIALLQQVYDTGIPYFGTEVPFVEAPSEGQPPRTTYFDFSYQALREGGQTVGICAFAFDVTDKVLARQLRDIQHRELTLLFEQAPAGVCILDGPELVYTFANPAYQAILPGRTLLGRSVLDVIPELRGSEIETLLRQVYATGETYRAQEQCIPVARPGGGELENRYFSLVYQARRDQDQRITGILNLVVEVTEQLLARQQAEHSRQQVQDLNGELAAINQELTTTNVELGDSNRQLTRTNVDLDNFIYTASHDLKAPITNIEGLLLALEHELPPAARTGDVSLMLTMMQDATERFRRTIEHLTDLSRLQKEHNPAAAAVALAPVVEAVRLDLTPLLVQTQGQLTVSIPEGLTVQFAEKNLRSVVYNLLSNAFKYHHPDRVPEVSLRSWLADDYTVLEVRDNGLGLNLSQGQEKLFAMFQRLHTHVEGTGVGLYMVKRIVENAGGRIEVSSELGQGSTFRVYFPL